MRRAAARTLCLLASLLLAGCATRAANEPRMMAAEGLAQSAPAGPAAPADRKIVRNADLVVEVDEPEAAAARAQAAVTGRGGFLESTYRTGEESIQLGFRVPAEALDALLDELGALGDVERSSLSSYDVTEQYADLAVRLANGLKLRERLQALLERATKVEEILAVEKELARVQTDVERLQGQLDRLESQVALSTVSLTLERGRVLGPLGYLGYGIYWLLEKLFVIR